MTKKESIPLTISIAQCEKIRDLIRTVGHRPAYEPERASATIIGPGCDVAGQPITGWLTVEIKDHKFKLSDSGGVVS